MERDILVIGGGPGGYVAAIRAAQLGAKVTLIEKNNLGGACLNRGCIPTKALYRNAEILHLLNRVDEFGIEISKEYKINVKKVQQRKDKIVNQLVIGVTQLLKANKVEVIKGVGSFIDKNTVEVLLESGEKIQVMARNIVIATGSYPFVPPIDGVTNENVITSNELLEFTDIPENLVIIGGGVIGMEFAGIFSAMGSKVTVIEAFPRILMSVDSDIAKRFAVMLKRRGIDVYADTKVTGIYNTSSILEVVAEGKKGEIRINADKVLIATGRIPVTAGLKLENVGIEFDRSGIKVDKNFMTNLEGIYAIGDVNGQCMLAHAASYQGVHVIEHILGHKEDKVESQVPNCIFVFPEIASVGITEDEAKNRGIKYNVSKSMFGANGKALSLGEGEGFVKVMASVEDSTIIGVHIMGPHASDLIHEGALAITKKMTCLDIKQTVHAHPTLGEAFYEAVLGLNKESINSEACKR